MSGLSNIEVCPRCGGVLQTYSDWKPYERVSGFCLNCGFTYNTISTLASLSEVNEVRAEMDDEEEYPQLAELSKPLADWVNSGWGTGLVREN